MATKKTGSSNLVKGMEAGAALAAVAAGAAGYYFYGTKNAKKHRQAASAWAKGLKSDVQKQVKGLKKIDAQSVAKIVDKASATYHNAKGVSKADVMVAAKELKANWKTIQKELAPAPGMVKAVKKAVKTAKKTTPKLVRPGKAVKAVKKSVKKMAKKVAKKK